MHKCIILTTGLITLTALTGCQSNAHSSNAILSDLTPNLDGLAETYSENDAGIIVVNNANERMYVDDWRRALILDKPSALSPYPVVVD